MLEIAFALVLAQLMIMPDVLIVENYRTMSRLGLVDTIPGIALPYIASAFGIFLLRQTFRTIPRELDDAAARIDRARDRRHAGHVVIGMIFCAASFAISWPTFLWFLPIVAGLMLSPVVSWATGHPGFGRRLWRANVFAIPEEPRPAGIALGEEAPVAILHPAE